MIEHTNTNVALDALFEEAYAIMQNSRHVPMTNKLIVDEEDLSGILEDLKEAIPKEIKSATQVLEEQKTIINKAYTDADRIVTQARDEAERIVGAAKAQADAMIQQEEIVKQANAEAQEMKASAEDYANQVRGEANEYAYRIKSDSLQYADDMLAYLSNQMEGALQAMAENRTNVDNELRSLSVEPQAEVAPVAEATEE